MNLKKAKALRKMAREMAGFGKLPKRQLLGGRHRIERADHKDPKTGVVTPMIRIVTDQGVNDRMSERGMYRLMKRDARRAA